MQKHSSSRAGSWRSPPPPRSSCSRSPRRPAPSRPPVQLGESSPVLSNPNQQAIAHGEDLAAKQEGWTVKHLDANLSPSKQVSDVDTFINLGVKGIVTWTLDPGTVAAAYKRALAKSIPIVDFGSTPTSPRPSRRARVRLQHG